MKCVQPTLLRLLKIVAIAFVCHGATGHAQDRQPQLMEGKKTLFKRVILRPDAAMHPSPGSGPATPMPAFSVLYVYGSSGDFVEVGRAIGRADGFVARDKVIEWKQTIVATFTNPANRQRSLLFKSRESIEELVRSNDAASRLTQLRTAAMRGETGDGPVLAIEPETWPDIRSNFYFFPILSEKPARLTFNQDGSILEVASLTAQSQASAAPPLPDRGQALRDFRVGVVFVVDTTVTMGPYIDRVRQAMIDLKTKLEQSPVRDNLRFGLIGFRQSLENNPSGIEYHVKTFLRLDANATADAFVRAIGGVKEASVPTRGWQEDSLGGVFEAIRGSDWQAFQARFVVLISDAGPMRDVGEQRVEPRFFHAPGLGAAQINTKAAEEKISVFVLHLLTPEGRSDHSYATSQYTDLARFEGGASGYFPVANGDLNAFREQLDRFANAVSSQITAAQQGASTRPPAPTSTRAPPDRIGDAVARNFYAMQLAYLGAREGARPPPMFQAYMPTYDLSTQGRRAVDVRVYLTKNQLSSMYSAAKAITDAAEEKILDANGFFTQVRQAMAIMARDPSRRIDARVDTLGSALGEFLEGLPFARNSRILSLTEADWRNMSGDAQVRMMAELGRKRRFMEDWHDNPANWVALTPNVPDGERVTAFPLEQLP